MARLTARTSVKGKLGEVTSRQIYVGPRTPWSLRIAAWAWAAAGFVFALCPLLATLLLWLQYRSLRKNAYRITDLIALFAPDGTVDLAPYIDTFERAEAWLLGAAGWMLVLILALYLVAAASIIAAYLVVAKYTLLGSRTARAFGTVLSVLSGSAVLWVWQAFAAIAWLPVDALWANHLGLAVVALHALGVALVWLPASNSFARSLASKRISAHTGMRT